MSSESPINNPSCNAMVSNLTNGILSLAGCPRGISGAIALGAGCAPRFFSPTISTKQKQINVLCALAGTASNQALFLLLEKSGVSPYIAILIATAVIAATVGLIQYLFNENNNIPRNIGRLFRA